MLSEKELGEIFVIAEELIKSLTGKEPYNYQKRIINRILKAVFNHEGANIACEFSRQSGKTEAVSMVAVFLFIGYFQICKSYNIPHQDFFNIGFFAPKEDQARTDFNRLKTALKVAQEKGIGIKFDEFNGNTITVTGDGHPKRQALCLSASPTAHIESKTLHLIILEEAQDLIDEKIKDAILPMGAHTRATVVYIGPAGYRRCLFKKMIDELPEENKVIITKDIVVAERREKFFLDKNMMHLNYERYIEEQIRTLGTNDDSFKTQYELVWILERGQFITYSELVKLESDYEIAKRNVVYDYSVSIGIDWGKAHDSTVMTIVNEHCQIIAWYEWQGDDYASQIEEIVQIIRDEFRVVNHVYCDSTGNQDMAVDMLRRKLRDVRDNVLVTGVVFTSKTKDELYKNLSKLMRDTMHGDEIVEEARLRVPERYDRIRKGKFIKQMIDLQKEIKNNLWRCQHPSGPEYHDDYPDSLALAVYGFTPKLAEVKEISWTVA